MAKKKSPYMPWYASDWLGSTKRAMMTLAQQGAYVNLLCHQWASEDGALPDDDDLLANLSGLGSAWNNGGGVVLRKCFPPHPTIKDHVANPRGLELRGERDAYTEQCRAAGRKSAEVRWGKPGNEKVTDAITPAITDVVTGTVTEGVTEGQRNGNRNGNTSSPLPSSPPLPHSASPSPPLSEAKAKPCPAAPNDSVDVKAVFDHYREYHRQAHKRPNSKGKEWKSIKARLAEDYTVDDLKAAIDGCHRSPWHMGENPGGAKYDSLELIMRDSSKVTQFMEVPEHAPVLSEASRRAIRAGQDFVDDDSIGRPE